jgi:hypothetical protein
MTVPDRAATVPGTLRPTSWGSVPTVPRAYKGTGTGTPRGTVEAFAPNRGLRHSPCVTGRRGWGYHHTETRRLGPMRACGRHVYGSGPRGPGGPDGR